MKTKKPAKKINFSLLSIYNHYYNYTTMIEITITVAINNHYIHKGLM